MPMPRRGAHAAIMLLCLWPGHLAGQQIPAKDKPLPTLTTAEAVHRLSKLRLRDETVRGLAREPPIVITTEFDVKPGAYLVRLVVRDDESRLITAENAAAQIP